MLDRFINGLEAEVKNHSVYVWGAQGESAPIISENWIKKKETNLLNAARAITYWKKQVKAGFGDKLKAFDCSGLGVYYLMKLKLRSSDTTANGLMGKCERIESSQLRKGCWVFRTYTSGAKKGKAYHIGYVVDDNLNVIEARGRDYGVVKRAYDKAYWNACGLPSYFTDEITLAAKPTQEPEQNTSRKTTLTILGAKRNNDLERTFNNHSSIIG